MVRKAPLVAEALSSKIDDKPARGHERQYAVPKDHVAQALGVSKGTLVNAEQHVATAETHPFMQSPDWSQSAVLQPHMRGASVPRG